VKGKPQPLAAGLDPGGEEPIRSSFPRSILAFFHDPAVTPDDAGGSHHTVLRIDERYIEALTMGEEVCRILPSVCF
jgi:hypothetical protein